MTTRESMVTPTMTSPELEGVLSEFLRADKS